MSSRIKRFAPSPSMAVALLALFVAMSGSAYASVKLSKNSVTTKTIKNGAVTNAKIKNSAVNAKKVKKNSLTGTQINEATLAGVNAATVGGVGPAGFVPSSALVRFNVPMNRGDAAKTLATFGPFTLAGSCTPNGPANFDVALTVSSTGSSSYYGSTLMTPGTPYSIASSIAASPTATGSISSEPQFHDAASGLTVWDGDGQQLGYLFGFPDANCRFFGSMFID